MRNVISILLALLLSVSVCIQSCNNQDPLQITSGNSERFTHYSLVHAVTSIILIVQQGQHGMFIVQVVMFRLIVNAVLIYGTSLMVRRHRQ